MENSVEINSLDDLFVFADEEEITPEPSTDVTPWKILVVDDETEVHSITDMVLRDVSFDNAPLQMIPAYSAAEAVSILKETPDIAVILLDVVMERDTAGLETVRIIREELHNRISRIVIRTGQPGKAPERSVILEYDINDYREKTELTSQKLFTTVISALRNYRDMYLLEQSRNGLNQVIDSSSLIFQHQSLTPFAQESLKQAEYLLQHYNKGTGVSGFIAEKKRDGFMIVAGSGEYRELAGRSAPSPECEQISKAVRLNRTLYENGAIVSIFESRNGPCNILYCKGVEELNDLAKDIISIFSNNVAIAYENIHLNIDMIDTQKDIILRMGDVVENRSKETANHVYRVAEFSYRLARKVGISEEQAQILRNASPMHDVGKVGIPDTVLLKPDKLTSDEFRIMKTHTTLGYKIFCKSTREIIQAAATIAYEHHERWDGKGYPRGLKGEEIHVFGRITSLADVFDALSSRRSYKDPWPEDQVFQFIRDNREMMFDPVLVDAFLEMREELMEIRRLYPDE